MFFSANKLYEQERTNAEEKTMCAYRQEFADTYGYGCDSLVRYCEHKTPHNLIQYKFLLKDEIEGGDIFEFATRLIIEGSLFVVFLNFMGRLFLFPSTYKALGGTKSMWILLGIFLLIFVLIYVKFIYATHKKTESFYSQNISNVEKTCFQMLQNKYFDKMRDADYLRPLSVKQIYTEEIINDKKLED